MTDKPYRLAVGIMLLSRDNRVFIGRRRHKHSAAQPADAGLDWQMPQGGIDPGEEPLAAALRELREETNVVSVDLLAEAPEWYEYDLPGDIQSTTWRGRYRGQSQRWFAFRFTGSDDEIDILHPAGGIKPEFVEWRWEELRRLPELIVPFKRPVYLKVVEAFAHLAEA